MEGGWAAINELFDEFRQLCSSRPFGREILDLLLTWDLASQEQPEEAFWEWLLTTRSFGKQLLTFWNCLAAESNALLRVKNRSFPDQRLDATGSAIDLVEGDLADDLAAVVFS
jgi:hypothetical protein